MIDVLLYGMLELSLGVQAPVDNPYDPAAVVVDVEVLQPNGDSQRWPAYFDGETWRWRHRPTQLGEHSAVLSVDGEDTERFVFHVEPSEHPGPALPDGYGFRHADGSPFVPLGLNLGWSAGGGTEDYARWFAALEAHGGNFARIWFTHFSDQDPEWPELGSMDPQASDNIDVILDLAREHGILVMPVLWQHSELESSMWSSWDGNPYNEANGGPCADSSCFFEDPRALAFQDAYLRYCVARWGAHPAVIAWEVMNELDGIVGVDSDVTAGWAAAHAETIRALEGGLHPVSYSYSLPPQAVDDQSWEAADFVQIHSYLLSDVEPVSQGVAAGLERYGGPVLVGEWGLDWFGNGDREDLEGLAWHNASWAALASGSAGNAMSWWWDDHIEPDDLWWRLEGLAAVIEGLDIPAMAPVEASVSDEDLLVLARSDGRRSLAWVHVSDHSPPSPDTGTVAGASLVLDGRPARARFLDTRDGAQIGADVVACDGLIALPDITGDIAVLTDTEGLSCDEPPQGCGCGAPPASRVALGGLVLALPLVGIRRRRGE
jgi:hypothetical protein